MLSQPQQKYQTFDPFNGQGFDSRTWPSKRIMHPPIWMSTDLRDGNQALFEPMNTEKKLVLFKELVKIGFKEIEVAFPSASQMDFNFVRMLIEQDLIPPDVTIEVLSQAREDLIAKTFESLKGAKQAIIHVYNATAPNFREIVFRQDKLSTRKMAQQTAELLLRHAEKMPQTHFTFQYSPEVFSGSELEFAAQICNDVIDIWQPTPDRKCIMNLPATVEMATPNIYADQIEWMGRQLNRRESVLISVHTHNDRGCAVAATELALMAGADRVEGCLFGQGERTGNVDIATLALNLYTQGIHPNLDFSHIHEIASIVEDCTQIPIHPRHPYVGDLVFTAFSGSHQDAIKKGLHVQEAQSAWQVPYLLIDPRDIGRSYESVIRVNSQSGKGGISYLLEHEYGIIMPRRLQIEFSSYIQTVMDQSGKEISAEQLWQHFEQNYLKISTPYEYVGHHLSEEQQRQKIKLDVLLNGQAESFDCEGNGPIDAIYQALASDFSLLHYEERAIGQGSDAKACSFIELSNAEKDYTTFGVGIHSNIITASILALISAVNRIYKHLNIDLVSDKRSA